MSDHCDIPLALYVHLPWCLSKCPYCDFNSHRAGEAPPKARYLDALAFDLESEARRVPERPLISVFFGGGTPSLFRGAEIGRLIDLIAAKFSLTPGIEITMEANPGAVERGALREYVHAGVNRLSLGAQSFDAGSLQKLGRIHGPEEIYSACAEASAAGFDSVNLDLMFALPDQDMESALGDVEKAVALNPQHISYYQLTLEPNTVFYRKPPPGLPGDELSFAMQQQGHAVLAGQGYGQYEISAFAREGYRCRHNLNYWTFGDYLGVGAGAHGKITDGSGSVRRFEKPKHPQRYIEQAECGSIDRSGTVIPHPDLVFEFMLNALRLPDGFRSLEFAGRTGLPVEAIEGELELAASRGLLEPTEAGGWRPTARGLRFHNDLVAMFLP